MTFRDDQVVVTLSPDLRENERTSHASIRGKHIVSCVDHRPVVINNKGDSFDYHRIGLTAPVKGGAVSELVEGDLTGEYRFAVARYDSVRDIYSDLSDPLELSPGLLNYSAQSTPSTSEGVPLGLDLVTPSATVRTKIRFEAPLSPVSVYGYMAFPTVNSIFLKLKASEDVETYPLIGTLTLRHGGRASEPVDASILTNDFTEIEFVMSQSFTAWSQTYDMIELTWSAADTQTDNCVLWNGFFTPPGQTAVDSVTTDPTFEAICEDAFNDGTTLTAANWLTQAGEEALSVMDYPVVKSTYARDTGRGVYMEDALAWNGIGPITLSQSITGVPIPARPTVESGVYFEQTYGLRFLYNPSITKYPTNGLFSIYANSSTSTTKKVGNRRGSSYPTIVVTIANPPDNLSDLKGKKIIIRNNKAYGTGLTPDEVRNYIVLKGICVGATTTTITLKNWEWSILLGLSAYPAGNGGLNVGDTVETGITPTLTVESYIDGQYVEDGKGPLHYRIGYSLRRYGNNSGTFSNPGGVIITGLSEARGDETTDQYDSLAICIYSLLEGEWYVAKKTWKDIQPAIYGQDLVTSGSFPATTSAWTLGTGWAISSNAAVHTPGNTETLEQFVDPPIGVSCVIAFTIENRTAGSVDVDVAGVSAGTFSANERHSEVITTVDSSVLSFTPTSDFDGSIKQVFFAKRDTGIKITSYDTTEVFVPENHYVFPAVRNIDVVDIGGDVRLVGQGMGGYDCFFHQPRLNYFTPSVRVDSTGTITLGANDVTAYRDGTYLATLYDGSDRVLLKAFVHDYDTETTGVNGETLTDYQLQLCKDFERAEIYNSDQDITGDVSAQRLEIRRQVVATVQRGSDRVLLSYDAAGSSLAEVANQAWVHQILSVGGAAGSEKIKKVATSGGTYDGSLDSGKTLGSEIVLSQDWENASAVGLLIVGPRNKTIFFGKGGFTDYELFGAGYEMDIKSQQSLKTLRALGDTVVTIAEANEIFVLTPTGFIVDPLDFLSATIFDVRQSIRDEKFIHPFSCVSTCTWFYPTRKIGFIGAEGPNTFDFVSVDLLLSDSERGEWGSYNRESLKLATAAVDPQHPYAPAVRIAGMKANGSSDRDRQLAYIVPRKTWLNFSGHAKHIDSMITVTMEDGAQRILFGGQGRLYLYGTPSREASNDPPNDIYLFPYVGGTQYGTITGTTANGNNAIVDSSATFTAQGDGYIFKGSNIRAVKIASDGTAEWATITERYSNTTLYVTPDSTWTNTDGETYKYIIGALEWQIRLPQTVPPAGYYECECELFKMDFWDNSSFDWQFSVSFTGSGDDPNLDGSAYDTVYFVKSDLSPMWAEETLQVSTDYTFETLLTGIRPPDSNLVIRGVTLGIRYYE